MYGSNFCSRTRRPRCSSSMPIEAQVSPLPSELTTPPVTKICLAMRGGPLRTDWSGRAGSRGRRGTSHAPPSLYRNPRRRAISALRPA